MLESKSPSVSTTINIKPTPLTITNWSNKIPSGKSHRNHTRLLSSKVEISWNKSFVTSPWCVRNGPLRRSSCGELVAEIFFDRIVVSTPCADAQQQWDLELREDVPWFSRDLVGPGRINEGNLGKYETGEVVLTGFAIKIHEVIHESSSQPHSCQDFNGFFYSVKLWLVWHGLAL